jgi:hypothetical protein
MVLANACGPCIGYYFPSSCAQLVCVEGPVYRQSIANLKSVNGTEPTSRRVRPTPSSRPTTVTSLDVTMPTQPPTPSSPRLISLSQ